MIAALVLVIAATVGDNRQSNTVRVDIWETNKFVDQNGKENFTQVILWKWMSWDGTWDFYVSQWRMAEKCHRPEHIRGKWIGIFDKQKVEAGMYIETVSIIDHEVSDRKRLPAERRRSK